VPPDEHPTLFVGSSSEGLPVAEHLHAVLDVYCEVNVWNQGTFGLSGTGIASLLEASRNHDFAVLVLTADDMLTSRGEARATARDNVLFEAGLFIGALGLERTFLVACRDDRLELPSDLDGVTRGLYRKRPDGRLSAALTPVALMIRERMQELGPRGTAANVGHDLEENLERLAGVLRENSAVERRLVEAIAGAGGIGQAVEVAAASDQSVPLRNLARRLAEIGHPDAAWVVAEPIPNNAERRNVGVAALELLSGDPTNDAMKNLVLQIYRSVRDPQRRNLRDAASRRSVDVDWPELPPNP
jgi:hypothetical protein